MTAPDEQPVEPPHLHGDFLCRSWHLTVRTAAGKLLAITTRDPDRVHLPPGWVILR